MYCNTITKNFFFWKGNKSLWNHHCSALCVCRENSGFVSREWALPDGNSPRPLSSLQVGPPAPTSRAERPKHMLEKKLCISFMGSTSVTQVVSAKDCFTVILSCGFCFCCWVKWRTMKCCAIRMMLLQSRPCAEAASCFPDGGDRWTVTHARAFTCPPLA